MGFSVTKEFIGKVGKYTSVGSGGRAPAATRLLSAREGNALIARLLATKNPAAEKAKFAVLAQRIQRGALSFEQKTMAKLERIFTRLDIKIPAFGDKLKG